MAFGYFNVVFLIILVVRGTSTFMPDIVDIEPYKGQHHWGPSWSHDFVREILSKTHQQNPFATFRPDHAVFKTRKFYPSGNTSLTPIGHRHPRRSKFLLNFSLETVEGVYQMNRFRWPALSSRGCLIPVNASRFRGHFNETLPANITNSTLSTNNSNITFRPTPDELWGHVFRVQNPLRHFSIMEPKGGCGNHTATPSETSRGRCLVATNAGYFNTHTLECHGNLITDGCLVQNTGVQNVNFGITRNGTFVVGYLSKDDVAGVVWLVREGKPYVNVSLQIENMTTQETGPTFPTVITARTAIGYDREGSLLLVTVEGFTPVVGANLYDMEALMIELGAVNAINLDGGGSTQAVVDDEIVTHPSDRCDPDLPFFTCPRRVTTIVCIHHGRHPTSPEDGLPTHSTAFTPSGRCRDMSISGSDVNVEKVSRLPNRSSSAQLWSRRMRVVVESSLETVPLLDLREGLHRLASRGYAFPPHEIELIEIKLISVVALGADRIAVVFSIVASDSLIGQAVYQQLLQSLRKRAPFGNLSASNLDFGTIISVAELDSWRQWTYLLPCSLLLGLAGVSLILSLLCFLVNHVSRRRNSRPHVCSRSIEMYNSLGVTKTPASASAAMDSNQGLPTPVPAYPPTNSIFVSEEEGQEEKEDEESGGCMPTLESARGSAASDRPILENGVCGGTGVAIPVQRNPAGSVSFSLTVSSPTTNGSGRTGPGATATTPSSKATTASERNLGLPPNTGSLASHRAAVDSPLDPHGFSDGLYPGTVRLSVILLFATTMKYFVVFLASLGLYFIGLNSVLLEPFNSGAEAMVPVACAGLAGVMVSFFGLRTLGHGLTNVSGFWLELQLLLFEACALFLSLTIILALGSLKPPPPRSRFFASFRVIWSLADPVAGEYVQPFSLCLWLLVIIGVGWTGLVSLATHFGGQLRNSVALQIGFIFVLVLAPVCLDVTAILIWL